MSHVEQIRRAAKDLQAEVEAADLPVGISRFLVAVGGHLEAAANREAGYRSSEPHAGTPEAGEESHLAWQIAAAWLGEDGPTC